MLGRIKNNEKIMDNIKHPGTKIKYCSFLDYETDLNQKLKYRFRSFNLLHSVYQYKLIC